MDIEHQVFIIMIVLLSIIFFNSSFAFLFVNMFTIVFMIYQSKVLWTHFIDWYYWQMIMRNFLVVNYKKRSAVFEEWIMYTKVTVYVCTSLGKQIQPSLSIRYICTQINLVFKCEMQGFRRSEYQNWTLIYNMNITISKK